MDRIVAITALLGSLALILGNGRLRSLSRPGQFRLALIWAVIIMGLLLLVRLLGAYGHTGA